MAVIKRLSKSELNEGLTLELVNSIDLKKQCSPVILKPGEDPVRLLVCSKGYNVILEDSKVLRDEKNLPMVFSEKEVQLGRARYLLLHLGTEKQEKIDDLVSSWKEEIQDKLNKLKSRVKTLSILTGNHKGDSTLDSLVKAHAERQGELVRQQNEQEYNKLSTAIAQLDAMLAENRIIELLSVLGIKTFDNPMLSVRFDDEQGMKTLVNTFSREALSNWDGDMLNRYASIEVEKEYLQ